MTLDPVISCPAPRVLYVNFDGARLRKTATDDAPNNGSSFLYGATVDYPPFEGTAQERASILSYVQRAFAPVNLRVVDIRPASGPYTMVMVGGEEANVSDPSKLRNAGGLGLLDCNDTNPQNLVYVFAPVHRRASSALRFPFAVATAIVHEVGHSFGLVHVGDRADAMNPSGDAERTYLLQDKAMPLHATEKAACDGTNSQNDLALLRNLLGAACSSPPPAAATCGPNKQVVFLNFEGGTVQAASRDDATTDSSVLVPAAVSPARVPPSQMTVRERADALALVRKAFKGVNVEIVDRRPTRGRYTTVYIGGSAKVLGNEFNGSSNTNRDCFNRNDANVAFVYDEVIRAGLKPPRVLSQEVAQAVTASLGSVFGLRQVDDPTDTMNPNGVSTRTLYFNDYAMPVRASALLSCEGTSTQNSRAMLISRLGACDVPADRGTPLQSDELEDGDETATRSSTSDEQEGQDDDRVLRRRSSATCAASPGTSMPEPRELIVLLCLGVSFFSVHLRRRSSLRSHGSTCSPRSRWPTQSGAS